MQLNTEFFKLLARNGYQLNSLRANSIWHDYAEKIDDVSMPFVPPRSKNVRYVSKDGSHCFLVVATSNVPNPFWGVSKRVFESLGMQKTPWSMVLLDNSVTTGFWFEPSLVRRLAGPVWQLGGDGYSYKIHAADIADGVSFNAEQKVLTLVGSLVASQ